MIIIINNSKNNEKWNNVKIIYIFINKYYRYRYIYQYTHTKKKKA